LPIVVAGSAAKRIETALQQLHAVAERNDDAHSRISAYSPAHAKRALHEAVDDFRLLAAAYQGAAQRRPRRLIGPRLGEIALCGRTFAPSPVVRNLGN